LIRSSQDIQGSTKIVISAVGAAVYLFLCQLLSLTNVLPFMIRNGEYETSTSFYRIKGEFRLFDWKVKMAGSSETFKYKEAYDSANESWYKLIDIWAFIFLFGGVLLACLFVIFAIREQSIGPQIGKKACVHLEPQQLL